MIRPSEKAETRPGRAGTQLTARTVVALETGFALVFTVISWLVVVVGRHQSFWSLFERGPSLPRQFALGLSVGAVASAACLLVIVRTPAFASFRSLARDLLARLGLTSIATIWMIWIALSAGWSEELLFRGTVQPLLGVWWTSLLFVAAHGAVDPRSRGKMLFGLFVFVCGIGLGFLYEAAGLVAAMSAHGAFDLVAMLGLQRSLAAKRAGEAGP